MYLLNKSNVETSIKTKFENKTQKQWFQSSASQLSCQINLRMCIILIDK